MEGLPVNLALKEVLTGTKKAYTFRGAARRHVPGLSSDLQHVPRQRPGPGVAGYLRPRRKCRSFPDPNVSGKTYANFENLPLEEALTRWSWRARRTCSRGWETSTWSPTAVPAAPAFPDISGDALRAAEPSVRPSESRNSCLRLSAGTFRRKLPARPIPTIGAHPDGHRAQGDRGQDHGDHPALDMSRRQVLLDARVVAMEKRQPAESGRRMGFPDGAVRTVLRRRRPGSARSQDRLLARRRRSPTP